METRVCLKYSVNDCSLHIREVSGILYQEISLYKFDTPTSCFTNAYKIYIFRDNIRRYHRITWEKNNFHHLDIPTRI